MPVRILKTLAFALLIPSQVLGQGSRATQTFHDPAYKLSFEYPANWSFTQKDHDISTFHFDARSAPRNTKVRAVVAIPENPFPLSTFSGAYVYFSVTPRSSESACARQATMFNSSAASSPAQNQATKTIGDVPFAHGHEDQRDICIVQRDDINRPNGSEHAIGLMWRSTTSVEVRSRA